MSLKSPGVPRRCAADGGVLLGNSDVSVLGHMYNFSLGCSWRDVHDFGGHSLPSSANWHRQQSNRSTFQCDWSFVLKMENSPEWGRFEEHTSSSSYFRADQPFSAKEPSWYDFLRISKLRDDKWWKWSFPPTRVSQ